ncbi:DNA helicase RecQ [Clostridium ganghwense]|uniref:DNA helicase RecQ n=1 Tax=Clostridium ganghwense TaxID=312089 RepID=A0ABT4CQL5_9CLOT|nr:DNA helicase RecQ [Clostridium ganghwense]MCY6370289.1 DNA helicase RecQ [Clostridium ganghwense]
MQENAREILKKYYGYTEFRKGQKEIIDSILEGKDTFAIMPTGGGKSLCYQIPAVMLEGLTLVISPLISLMKDQVDSLNSLGISAGVINSTQSINEVKDTIYRAAQGELKLLYVAPERLDVESFYRLLQTLNVSQIAIDEAHCASQWGHDFRLSYRAIAPFLERFHPRPVVSAFTATATVEVKEDVVKILGLKEPNTFITGFDRQNLSFSVIKNENKNDFILKYLEDNKDKSGIIYAATRKEVDNVYIRLQKKGYSVGRYHAGMSDNERQESQEQFLYDDIKIMVATNAFGMGIDKSNVRFVIHYNMPKNIEAYYQEAGRAGRDGESGECILLFGPRDTMLQKFFIEQTVFTEERKINEYRKLQAMVDYCHTTRCLRKYILEYFGERNVQDKCDNCGSCKNDGEIVDITIDAQKIFSCIYRMKEKYGVTMAAEVLRGSKNQKVLNLEFDKLSTYGIMKNYTIKGIKDLINTLIAEEYLTLTEEEFAVVKLRNKAVEVLKNKQKVMQKVYKRKEKVKVDNSLFDKLREVRKIIAQREAVPPYIVFADSSLKEMSEIVPLNREEMLNIKGVGEKKFEKYGEEFLQVLIHYNNEHKVRNIEDKVVEEAAVDKEKKIPSHVSTYNMLKEGKSLEEIVQHRGIKRDTVKEHIMRCGLEGLEIDWNIFIPKKYEELILEKIKEVGCERLKPIKELLPDDVDYNAIKAVLCKYKNAN